ncbi:MAG: hypothetical protein KGL39_59960 [Patescibacteria group bacterium]|nr:hypothetical protein [Patescibacteria group bacterium]
MISEEEAKAKVCPLTFSQPGGPFKCIAGECMMWAGISQTMAFPLGAEPRGWADEPACRAPEAGFKIMSRPIGECSLSRKE